ncbi:endonuclease/exonuclease/phosphatase family protein [Caldimonas brevitalea]|uniref:Metal-dependent hydrolase n=1 Tax=Caldimonas brevitalea TaxID=413882 RepID=A0A0G3BUK4_9BURK|nr:endonuclease/exonuclease/phosphatase family protein [Caldimonas brevitalea]AKJ30215.1 metal-dependent hydrolase [Caldimonas brevitalea]
MPELVLTSWNIQWGRGVDGRVDLDRIVQTLMAPGAPGVVLLQEVADGFADLAGHDGSDQFEGLRQRLAGYTVVEGVATDLPGTAGRRQRFGNLLAARLPVGQAWRHLLPWPAEDGVASMQRVAVEATLQAPFGPLRVTTTHLEYYAPRQRRAQAQRLRELHREAVQQSRCDRRPAEGAFALSPRAASAVLCGDFNCGADSDELALLLQPFDDGTARYCDAWPHLHPGRPHAPTLGLYDHAQWPQGPQCFDFFLVSEDLLPRLIAIEVDAQTQHSDHQPVRLRLDAA